MTKTEGEKAKTSIKVDPDLWKSVKIAAIQQGIEVSTFVETALKNQLGSEKESVPKRAKTS